MPRTFGLIPAAGKSRRMGRPKLSLPLAGKTVLESVVAAVTEGGVEKVIVVIAPGESELRALGEKAGAEVLELPADTAEMRDTVEHGLSWLENQYHPGPDDGWLLLPADHPCVDGEVVRQLLKAAATDARRSIIVPTFEGNRGHPVWIGWRHVPGIRNLPSGAGLNSYLRQYGDESLELPVSTPSVLWDLDTPEDYHQLRLRMGLPER